MWVRRTGTARGELGKERVDCPNSALETVAPEGTSSAYGFGSNIAGA
jgi:hypothetical protein